MDLARHAQHAAARARIAAAQINFGHSFNYAGLQFAARGASRSANDGFEEVVESRFHKAAAEFSSAAQTADFLCLHASNETLSVDASTIQALKEARDACTRAAIACEDAALETGDVELAA